MSAPRDQLGFDLPDDDEADSMSPPDHGRPTRSAKKPDRFIADQRDRLDPPDDEDDDA